MVSGWVPKTNSIFLNFILKSRPFKSTSCHFDERSLLYYNQSILEAKVSHLLTEFKSA